MDWGGLANYALFFIVYAGIYAILALGLNIQWGYTGLFNIGISGFFLVGAYTSTIVTKAPAFGHLGGFNQPIIVGMLAAGVLAGAAALLIALPTLRLRDDYLAIATIGIAETLRLVAMNEQWLTAGVWGIAGIPQPLRSTFADNYNLFFAGFIIVVVALVYFAIERGIRSPWGRVLKAIREDEDVAAGGGQRRVQVQAAGPRLRRVRYGHRRQFVRPFYRLHKSRGVRTDERYVSRLGYAHRRGKRQLPRRDFGCGRHLGHLVGHGHFDRRAAACTRSPRPRFTHHAHRLVAHGNLGPAPARYPR